jgi:hypothetical protein
MSLDNQCPVAISSPFPACLPVPVPVGAPCTCLVTDTAPQAKITAIESYGASIVRAPWVTPSHFQSISLTSAFI